MKIGLCDVDSHNFPNLCLMKLSAYHKAQGDSVEWWSPEGHYDRVYKGVLYDATVVLDDDGGKFVRFKLEFDNKTNDKKGK